MMLDLLVTRDQLLATARSWIGTPHHHQGQRKGVGVDCKGFVVGVAAELEMPEARSLAAMNRNYCKAFSGKRMYDGLADTLVKVDEALPGDLLAILMGRDPFPRHLAFVTEKGWIIHTYGGGIGRVCEVPLGQWRVHSRWTWPSLGSPHG